LKQLGEGGFGKVWLAKSSITQERAAIKILKL
jgi:serine/threonine protein kinase